MKLPSLDWLPVGKHWSRVLSMGCVEALSDNWDSCQNLIIIIPGNPGVDQFYQDFSKDLLNNLSPLDKNTAVLVPSHLNHVNLPPELKQYSKTHSGNEVFLLSDQIAHKLQFIRSYIPKSPRIFLIGHSIGCYIILKILKELLTDGYNIIRAIMLFPTVERMADTPNARIFLPFTNLGIHKIGLFLSPILDYCLPDSFKKLIFYLTEGKISSNGMSEAVCEVISSNGLKNMVYMGLNELQLVNNLETELIVNNYSNLLLFYYGTKDKWCPLSYANDMKKLLSYDQVIICDNECEHAFVVSDGEVVARKVDKMIKDLII